MRKLWIAAVVPLLVCACLWVAGFRLRRYRHEDPGGVHAAGVMLYRLPDEHEVELVCWSETGAVGLIFYHGPDRAPGTFGIGDLRRYALL